tara:strand:- start:1208 stop:2020 length:813 start_codon:yes stop_codon:yes gene_type:complete
MNSIRFLILPALMDRFINVTATSKSIDSRYQLESMVVRYSWASNFCKGKDVLEIACGTGQGLSLILPYSKTLKACDISKKMIKIAKKTYSDEKLEFTVSDASNLPYKDNSLDVILLFECIYYFENIDLVFNEIKRVIRPKGIILISTANSDLYDFNPSPYSFKYYGAKELASFLKNIGFRINLFGYDSIAKLSFKSKVFRLLKFIAVKTGVMPKTMKSKTFFKRFVFGELIKMPSKLSNINFKVLSGATSIIEPVPNKNFRIILASATLK